MSFLEGAASLGSMVSRGEYVKYEGYDSFRQDVGQAMEQVRRKCGRQARRRRASEGLKGLTTRPPMSFARATRRPPLRPESPQARACRQRPQSLAPRWRRLTPSPCAPLDKTWIEIGKHTTHLDAQEDI